MFTATTKIADRNEMRSREIRLLLLIALLPIAYGFWLGLVHLKSTWDDGAITAAFARTWAQTGHIALTPSSQTVEGFSSVLWFWLLSVPYFFSRNPDVGLVWMKVLSAVFFAASVGLIYSIASRELRSQIQGIAAALLFAFCITPLREMQNGMEMNLATFLILLLFRTLAVENPRVLYCWLLTSLILLTRFESPFWLLLMLCAFLYARKNQRTLIKIALLTVCTFAAIELWRHHFFGAWMPNTVYAKRWKPYSDWSTPEKFFKTRLDAVREILIVLPAPIFAALVRHRNPKVHPAVWALAFGCVLFGAIFGQNWGQPGRMVEPMIPFLLIVLIGACSFRATSFGLIAVLCLQGYMWYVFRHPHENPDIANVQSLGEAINVVRVSVHRKEITADIIDVGGSSLCCEHLRIVDAGLLANPLLAHKGWNGFNEQFHTVNPDVVQANPYWSKESHIFESGLLNSYCEVKVRGVDLYIRRDLNRCSAF